MPITKQESIVARLTSLVFSGRDTLAARLFATSDSVIQSARFVAESYAVQAGRFRTGGIVREVPEEPPLSQRNTGSSRVVRVDERLLGAHHPWTPAN